MAGALTVSVRGLYLGQEHKSGTSKRDGVDTPYEYDQAHILVGTEVVHARIDEEFVGPLPKENTPCQAELRLSPYRSASGAEIAARLLRVASQS